MKSSKWFKGLIMAMGFTLISSVSAFAATSEDVQAPDPAMAPTYVVAGEATAQTGSGTAEPGSATSTVTAISQDILDRQAEIDQYLFKDHSDELVKAGFKVTHTAPMDGYVEVGILPFTDANADYIYKALGNDKIKVVEGIEAVPLKLEENSQIYETTMVPADGNIAPDGQGTDKTAVMTAVGAPVDDRVYKTTSAPEAAKDPVDNATWILAIGAVVLLGGGFAASRRMKTAGKSRS